MAEGFSKPAMTVVGLAGLCVSIASGVALGAYTVTGIDPLSAHGTMTSVPYAGGERDSRAAAGPNGIAVADTAPPRSDWVGEDSGRADTRDF